MRRMQGFRRGGGEAITQPANLTTAGSKSGVGNRIGAPVQPCPPAHVQKSFSSIRCNACPVQKIAHRTGPRPPPGLLGRFQAPNYLEPCISSEQIMGSMESFSYPAAIPCCPQLEGPGGPTKSGECRLLFPLCPSNNVVVSGSLTQLAGKCLD